MEYWEALAIATVSALFMYPLAHSIGWQRGFTEGAEMIKRLRPFPHEKDWIITRDAFEKRN